LENRRTEKAEVIVKGVDLLEKIKRSKVRDDKVVKAVEEIKRAGVKVLRDEEWKDIDGVMYREEKVYVPKDEMLRAEIIRLHHDTPVGGHRGQWKMVELVTQNFWWPGITKEVKQYVEGCNACQCNKKLHRTTGRKINTKLDSRKAIDAYISRLYHQVAFSTGI